MSRWLLILVILSPLCSCDLSHDCIVYRYCCASCDSTTSRKTCGSCNESEINAANCPARSECALDAYVGDEKAICCIASCSSTLIDQTQNRCDEQDVYLHECSAESDCYQSYRAETLKTTYLPIKVEQINSAAHFYALSRSENYPIFLVGSYGQLFVNFGMGWLREELPTTEHLLGVATSSLETWVVGRNGLVLKRNTEGNWQAISSPFSDDLLAVTIKGENEIWVAGVRGQLGLYDGSTWTDYSFPADNRLNVLISDEKDLWVAGERGLILRFNQGIWVDYSLAEDLHISALAIKNSELWCSTSDGQIFSRKNEVWGAENLPQYVGIYALFAREDELFAAGQMGIILRKQLNQSWENITYFQSRSLEDVDFLTIGAAEGHLYFAGVNGLLMTLKE